MYYTTCLFTVRYSFEFAELSYATWSWLPVNAFSVVDRNNVCTRLVYVLFLYKSDSLDMDALSTFCIHRGLFWPLALHCTQLGDNKQPSHVRNIHSLKINLISILPVNSNETIFDVCDVKWQWTITFYTSFRFPLSPRVVPHPSIPRQETSATKAPLARNVFPFQHG